ncbi:protein SLOW GREEN 1, chloroplastic [Capsicum baccatum]|uniref:Protein SLOW GREEN 1, chloroplastic n=1 Tax=Capsicum baccatum TaxID=33114 RepID=A0A2G2XSC3_CAPBA|nr:protein SLOW GREEN 1, chloroplastic [Capsicum baccatum]
MNSTLTINSSSSFPSILTLPTTTTTSPRKAIVVPSCVTKNDKSNPFVSTLKYTGLTAIIFSATIALKKLPARAETPQIVLTEQQQQKKNQENPLTQFLESNAEAIDALKNLLKEKLESGEDEESLSILKKLLLAQPDNQEWKFLVARLLNEMGRIQESREVFEEILLDSPLSFEALFENALLMDRCGEGANVIKRLEEALKLADDEGKLKECRDIRFIIAQVQFLQKNIDEALRSYDELEKEDPKDFRSYFCKGMIYSLLDRNKEAREQFAKYKELSPRKFEVEGYLRTALSRMKLFGTDEKES